jgi:hydroxymethylpyrimidine/phosphomethylpyrimidine kinase
MMPVACTIAGSDSGGGAGVQADLKTFTALDVWGTTVVTALTAQNPREVRRVCSVPESMVAAQLETVLDGFDVRALKTGMLATAGIIRTVAAKLPAGIPLVVDPVMVATSGSPLLNAGQELAACLVPRATVVTPNIPEALVLTGMPAIATVEDMKEAAARILDLGAEYVVVKGGHLTGDTVTDLLAGPGTELVLTSPRHPYEVHGSGCCFSAAITAYLARGYTVPDAFREAKVFIDSAIARAYGYGGTFSVNPR